MAIYIMVLQMICDAGLVSIMKVKIGLPRLEGRLSCAITKLILMKVMQEVESGL